MLDFGSLGGGKGPGNANTEPRKIFPTLIRHPRFKFLSYNQGEVLDSWHIKRTRSDNTIKMNTGSGKMLVGLVALQSSLNEGVGPALYLAPDNYLVGQVLEEAKALGISATDDPRSADYLAGRSIAVANIDRLVNGRSIFGVGSDGVQIPVGTVVIDDAHACLSSVASQFTIRLAADHPAYDKLLDLFEDSLRQQSLVGYVEVKNEDPNSLLPVPFWAWQDKQDQVLALLHPHRDGDQLRFSWPLLKEVMSQCQCVFGAGGVEIAPKCLPIDVIPSFVKAKRRIYMTATLADDGMLIEQFDADPVAVADPIKPKGAGEIGDRMIIVPHEVNDAITDDDVKSLAADVAQTRNVVVIVPSERRSKYWADVASQTLMKSNISAGVAGLKAGHVGLTVLVNRYDGVDLPDDACRLLIIDGLPEVHGLIERHEAAILEDTQSQLRRQMQRIEQGMGRGVRSGEDRCAVLLLGARLTQRINQPDSRGLLTPATLTQMDMGREVTRQIKGKTISDLRPILDLCMERNTEDGMNWWRAGRERLANTPEGAASHVDPSTEPVRKAFNAVRDARHSVAVGLLQDAVNLESEKATKGYLKQQLAEVIHRTDPVAAQQTLLSASTLNRRVVKPIAGIGFVKLDSPAVSQAKAAVEYMAGRFLDTNQFVYYVNALCDDLQWDKERTDQFEGAMRDLGSLLGFGSQRPDREFRSGGPDNLWALGGLNFLVIECKSGVDNDGRSISKDHANQLSGAMNWFGSSYDASCKATPVLVHPSHRCVREASPHADMRVVDKVGLVKLRSNLKAYATALAAGPLNDEAKVRQQLTHFGLAAETFVPTFTATFKSDS
ncbi:MAG: helicase C-terminal domain-containing protein [Candidatus Devosia phytovorans]|uniref:Helicase C-terminal domain-containing protein n=1 Tax=Candidatus Devosia phytovorans TaxID=3121372 RepID=A0AAJ5VSB0_9HYPH|nr:helicase C-terminal domain-containing protein [Devosia sp.]WEK03896.1 MAG: helicase C-terminal domain-containing protein [Devosia sp.]